MDTVLDFNGLNTPQIQSITHIEGPAVVYAGAGSGKTRVICLRIAHLILDKKVAPSSILGVTFTNKAAKEMKERVEVLVGPEKSRNLIISTFHSFCARYLRKYAENIGFDSAFSIYDDDDQKSVLKEILKTLNISDKLLSVPTVKSKIDKIKNEGLSPSDYLKKLTEDAKSVQNEQRYSFKSFGEQYDPALIHKVYEHYQNKLKSNNAMDFNDLILNFVSLLRESETVLSQMQNRFKYFLVDEFQDTNPVQFKLISLLSQESKNLFIVGDDDQSIYSWRGADPSFILDFTKIFEQAKMFRLEQNYRSTKNIIDSSAKLISRNYKRAHKKIFTQKDDGSKITVFSCSDPLNEAKQVIEHLFSKVNQGTKFSDVCFLYRTNAQSRLIEDELRKRMVPYVIFGSVRFYERAEIKILLSYIKILVNPSDEQAFIKIVNTPRRGFGEAALAKLKEAAVENNMSCLSAATEIVYLNENFKSYEFKAISGIKHLIQSIQEWKHMLTNQVKPSHIILRIISDIRFEEYVRNTYPEDFDERWLNIVEFKNAIIDFESQSTYENEQSVHILAEFLEQALLTVQPTVHSQGEEQTKVVTLMTIHSAKGLEFDTVFVTGLEEGVFPHQNALSNEDSVEEERRLMYVAMTRAQNHLILSHSKRNRYKDFIPAQPSRFLNELPQENVTYPFDIYRKELYKSQTYTSTDQKPKAADSFKKESFREELKHKLVKAIDLESKIHKNNDAGSEWNAGGRVNHRIFGDGTIKDVEKSTLGFRVKVNFDRCGEKTMIHTYLTKV